jgi:hypothetical protein
MSEKDGLPEDFIRARLLYDLLFRASAQAEDHI